MIVQVVRFRSSLSFEELLEIAEQRAPQFRALPGLLQKYYTQTVDHTQTAGIYIWESEEAMKQFRDSELAASIPQAYEVIGAPDIEFYEVAFSLRTEPEGVGARGRRTEPALSC